MRVLDSTDAIRPPDVSIRSTTEPLSSALEYSPNAVPKSPVFAYGTVSPSLAVASTDALQSASLSFCQRVELPSPTLPLYSYDGVPPATLTLTEKEISTSSGIFSSNAVPSASISEAVPILTELISTETKISASVISTPTTTVIPLLNVGSTNAVPPSLLFSSVESPPKLGSSSAFTLASESCCTSVELPSYTLIPSDAIPPASILTSGTESLSTSSVSNAAVPKPKRFLAESPSSVSVSSVAVPPSSIAFYSEGKSTSPNSTSSSFYGAWKDAGGARKETTAAANAIVDKQDDKVLPASQSSQADPVAESVVPKENSQISSQNSSKISCIKLNSSQISCNRCQRIFSTEKGLKRHKHSCKAPEIVNPTETETNVQNNLGTSEQQQQQPPTEPRKPAENIWGNHSQDELNQIADAVYDETVFWRKNLFKVPSGAAGKNFIREMTRLIEVWSGLDGLANASLKMLMILPGIMLQKPSRKSTSRQHSEYLTK